MNSSDKRQSNNLFGRITDALLAIQQLHQALLQQPVTETTTSLDSSQKVFSASLL